MGRSYDSALELLDSVQPALEFITEDLRSRHNALHEEAERGAARRRLESERASVDAPPAEDTEERTVWKAPGQGGDESRPEMPTGRDLEELQKLANDAETIVSVDELQAVSARVRVLATRNGDDQQLQSFADGVTKVVTTRIDALTRIGSNKESATQYAYEAPVFRPATPDARPFDAEGSVSPSPVVPVRKEETRKVEPVVVSIPLPPAKQVKPVKKEEPHKVEPVVTGVGVVRNSPGPPPLKPPIPPKPTNFGTAPAGTFSGDKQTPEPPFSPRTTASVPHVKAPVPARIPARSRLRKPALLAAIGVIAALVLAFVVWKSHTSGPATESQGTGSGTLAAVVINSTPVGATVEVHNEKCVTPNCSVPLAPGDYELRASLAGYAPVLRNVHVGSDAATPPLDLTFTPLPSTVHINTNLSRGEATLDGHPVGRLREGQLNLAEVTVGQHTIRISGKSEKVEIGFRALAASAPEISSPVVAQNVSALIVANRTGQLRLLCNCDNGTPIALDGHPVSPIVSGRQDLGAVSEGSHQIQISAGENARTHIVNVTGRPALDIFLDAESKEGVLVIQTGVDKATVYLDGRKSGETGSDGIYRKSLPLKNVSVAVSKSGYRTPPTQIASIGKNGETGIRFDLQPVAQKATLQVAGGQPDATISLDGQALGSLDGAGRYSADVSPGNHTIEISKTGFQTKKQNMSFTAGVAARLDAAMTQNAQPVQPPPPPVATVNPTVVKPFTPTIAPPTIPADQKDWPGVDKNKEKDLQAFIQRYPESPLANAARDRVRQLQASSDRSGVLSALGRYSDAYQHRNTDELEAVWPSLIKQDRKKISDSFKNAVAIQMKLRPTGDPSVSGDSAVVTCERDLIYTFAGGIQKTFSGEVTIRLRKKAGVWLIEGTS